MLPVSSSIQFLLLIVISETNNVLFCIYQPLLIHEVISHWASNFMKIKGSLYIITNIFKIAVLKIQLGYIVVNLSYNFNNQPLAEVVER